VSIYSREYPGVRREIEHNAGGYFDLWPKLNGVNVRATAVVSCSVGSAVCVDIMDGATPVYSRLRVTITAGQAPERGENFPVEVAWTGPASTSGREVVVYDVVRNPCGPLVSLNLARQGRPGVYAICERNGKELSATPLTPDEACGIYAASARVELQDKLRLAAAGLTATRPALILDRDRLLRAEVALTRAHVYESVAKDPVAGTDVDSAQARFWRAAFEVAWQQMGPLAVDADPEDGAADSALQKPAGGAVRTHRA
jgi:hypothetical protein